MPLKKGTEKYKLWIERLRKANSGEKNPMFGKKGKENSRWKEKLNKICPICNIDFDVIPSHEWRECCSIECKNKLHSERMSGKNTKPKIHKICPVCNIDFDVIPSQKDRKCCSKECQDKLQTKPKIQKICPICKIDFEVKPCEEFRRECCSKECMGKIQSKRQKGKKRPNIAEQMMGEKNHWYGKHPSQETRDKLSKAGKGRKRPPRTKEWQDKINKKLIKFFQNPENRNKISERQRRACQNLEYRKKMLKNLEVANKRRPTNPEKFFNELTPDIVRYVGNGKWWRNHHNPDFKITGQNKVIEVYGDYWHRNDNPDDRINEYKGMGLECLVFWESEIYKETDKVLRKVKKFITI